MALSDLVINPETYFQERVLSASRDLKVRLTSEVEAYVVHLLVECIRTNDDDVPLVVILQRAYATDQKEEKLRHFRQLGDTSLYVSGYFQDYFNRRLFDIGYYIDMGRMAYSSAAAIAPEKPFAKIAENFSQIVDVIAQVSTPSSSTDLDLLSIYDRWQHSHSDRLRKILQEHGIDPVQVAPRTAH